MTIIYELCDKCKKQLSCDDADSGYTCVSCDDYVKDEKVDVSFGSRTEF